MKFLKNITLFIIVILSLVFCLNLDNKLIYKSDIFITKSYYLIDKKINKIICKNFSNNFNNKLLKNNNNKVKNFSLNLITKKENNFYQKNSYKNKNILKINNSHKNLGLKFKINLKNLGKKLKNLVERKLYFKEKFSSNKKQNIKTINRLSNLFKILPKTQFFALKVNNYSKKILVNAENLGIYEQKLTKNNQFFKKYAKKFGCKAGVKLNFILKNTYSDIFYYKKCKNIVKNKQKNTFLVNFNQKFKQNFEKFRKIDKNLSKNLGVKCVYSENYLYFSNKNTCYKKNYFNFDNIFLKNCLKFMSKITKNTKKSIKNQKNFNKIYKNSDKLFEKFGCIVQCIDNFKLYNNLNRNLDKFKKVKSTTFLSKFTKNIDNCSAKDDIKLGKNSIKNTSKNLTLDNEIKLDYNRKFTFIYKGKKYIFNSNELLKDVDITPYQKRLFYDRDFYLKTLENVKQFNLSKREIIAYFYPEIEIIKEKLCKIINIEPEDDIVELKKDTCEINFKKGYKGIYLNQELFYNAIFKALNNKNNIKNDIEIKIFTLDYKENSNLEEKFKEKSCFSTNFGTSSPERKSNIRLALSKFDGLVLEEGEIFKFNSITGIRNEENGYKKAKIISNGTFIDGFGGGVCQVSTTLYNACLLAGMEILEVHNHSLPVSYVQPSFDAMVNTGSSDLIVRNNTGGKILITTSSLNDVCKVKIYGLKNKYKIEKYSEKIEILPAKKDVIDTNYLNYNLNKIEIGDEIRVSFPKEGFISNGYLKYYDDYGRFIKKVKIRTDKYYPTRGVIVKRES